jgi:hypothetical protein
MPIFDFYQMWSIAASCLHRSLGVFLIQGYHVRIKIILVIRSEHVTTYFEDTTHIIESSDHVRKLSSVEPHAMGIELDL